MNTYYLIIFQREIYFYRCTRRGYNNNYYIMHIIIYKQYTLDAHHKIIICTHNLNNIVESAEDLIYLS